MSSSGIETGISATKSLHVSPPVLTKVPHASCPCLAKLIYLDRLQLHRHWASDGQDPDSLVHHSQTLGRRDGVYTGEVGLSEVPQVYLQAIRRCSVREFGSA